MTFWLRLNMFFRSFFLQSGWNYVRYQNLGFAFVMMPFLRRLYQQDPGMLPTVLQRYLEAFNTHPVMASFCFGAMAKQEESVARTTGVAEYKEQVAEWSGSRRGLSITAASIGDRLFWGALKPLTLLLAVLIWMVLDVNFFEVDRLGSCSAWYAFSAGAAAFFIYNSIALFVRWQGLKIGYESDEKSCFGLTRFDWNRTIYKAKRIGLFCAVGLILFGLYRYFGRMSFSLEFAARALLAVFFILLSFFTRRMRIPNVYLYLTAAVVFAVACMI